MTAHFLVGDVRDRMAQLEDGSFDFILCSPPFLALRSYLPEDHPDKAKEIGSEATPAEFIDTLLDLTAEWGRLLAPHGSIAIELGDTYAGSGGAGGDYDPDGLRDGQARFDGSGKTGRLATYTDSRGNPAGMRDQTFQGANTRTGGGRGWPLDKSLASIPQLYQVALAYGINPLTGRESPAGRWRVRNLKPWIRSNPPVGALGDKERPATSYVVVATRARDRWFDLDAVRTPYAPSTLATHGGIGTVNHSSQGPKFKKTRGIEQGILTHPAGAPPRDWWHHVDAILDTELAARASSAGPVSFSMKGRKHTGADNPSSGWAADASERYDGERPGAQGVHLRRALERAGILQTQEALDVSPRGYTGAHYAVWPMELVKLLINEMCPRFVCPRCGPIRALESVDEATSLRDMRKSDHVPVGKQSNRSEAPVLFESVCHESQVGSQTSRDGSSGLPTGEPSVRLRSGSPTRSPDGSQVGLAIRTSSADGGTSGADVDRRRSRPSQERDSGRQPNREPRTDDAAGPPQSAEPEVETEALPALRRDGLSDKPCPTCGADLRRGRVLDPFVGSGTTLAVATGMGRDATGIDIDERNALLARERVGMFLEVVPPGWEVPA